MKKCRPNPREGISFSILAGECNLFPGENMKADTGNSVLELIDGDITEMDTDAIVNAANSMLIMGGGVGGR